MAKTAPKPHGQETLLLPRLHGLETEGERERGNEGERESEHLSWLSYSPFEPHGPELPFPSCMVKRPHMAASLEFKTINHKKEPVRHVEYNI